MAGESNENQNQNEVEITQDAPVENGLSAEEQAQFDAMRSDEGAAPADVEQVADAKPKGDGKPADVVQPALKAEGEDDDDEGTPEPGREGQAERIGRRVSRKKYESDVKQRDTEIKALRDAETKRVADHAKLEERLAIINEALTPKQQAKAEGDDDPEPDPNEDFIAHSQWQSRENKRLRESLNEMRGGLNQSAQENQISQAYGDDAVMFAQREPSFTPAYQFLMSSRVVELAEYYYGKDLTQEGDGLSAKEVNRIRQTIQNEERDLVTGALKAGQSPAQRIYRLAVARGFRKAAPVAADAKPNGTANGNGKAPGNLADAAAAATSPKPSVGEEIDRLKRGVESSTSLSQAGGAPGVALTPEKLANMPQDEFAALVDQLSEGELKRVMGGA